MTLDEGYIKYQSRWTPGPPPDRAAARQLEAWRNPLFAARLIGRYEDLGIGYGNISVRCGAPGQFLISGTQTGQIENTDEQHYSLVTSCDVDKNTVACTGPVQASSEAMTHAAIYALDPRIGAVVHVHDKVLWQTHLNQLPTTDPAIAYGTPDMAREFQRLFTDTEFADKGVAVMAGHEEGLISFGATLGEAANRLLNLVRLQGQAQVKSETSDRP
jgi:ribulose-5-phosphate 4-epimerase/fuculose-1-phosphate aldolase